MTTLSICFVVYAGYATYKNYKGNFCEEKNKEVADYCGAKWKTLTSAGNRDLSEVDSLEKYLGGALMFVLLVVRIFFFRSARKKDCDIDELNTTPVDYTIMISGLPREMTEHEVIKNFADYDLGNKKKPIIEKINYAYYIGDFIRFNKRKIELEKKLYLENKKHNGNKKKTEKYNDEIGKLEKKLDLIEKTLNGKMGVKEKAKLFTGICFLTFKTQLDAERVLEKWKVSFFGVIALKYLNFLRGCFTGTKERIRGKVVEVSEPPEPSDILWENLGTPFGIKLKRRILTFFLTVFLLAFSFVTILGLKYAQFKYIESQSEEGVIKTGLSLIITGFISTINALLKKVMRWISLSEKYSTMTGYHTGVLWKFNLVIFLLFSKKLKQFLIFKKILIFFIGAILQHCSDHCFCELDHIQRGFERNYLE